MKPQDPKYIVRKLLQDTLTVQEQETVLYSETVTKKMKSQWDTAPDSAKNDRVNDKKIFRKIQNEAWGRVSMRKLRFYQTYAWAASFLLLLGLAGFVYFISARAHSVPHYFASTGIQNIQEIVLPDGSNVQLGPGSTLSYPSQFTGKKREITLNGQAFFTVQKDAKKPFIVHTPQMQVEALGTSFELFAYQKQETMEAILLEGKIKVSIKDTLLLGKPEVFLAPDEKIEYNVQHRKVIKTNVNANNYTSWRKGILSFESEKLSMIIPRLEQWYGRKIFFDEGMGETYKFTFKVRNEPLDRILYIMGKSSPIKYNQSDDGNFSLYLRE